MENIISAIERIQRLECPTGELENRVAEILESYQIASRGEILINRKEQLDQDGAEAYCVEIGKRNKEFITILAISGSEDYVAKVVDVYQN